MNRPTLALGTLGASILLSAPAALAQDAAQQTCGQRAEIVSKLNRDFKENQEAVGLVNDQAVIELYISGKGTWTIIASGTDGTSCVVSAGKDWEGQNFVKGLDTKLHRPAAATRPERID